MSNYKQQISKQLSALSSVVPSLSDEELCAGVLDACSGLVSVLFGNIKDLTANPDSIGELASCLDGLQLQMNKLADAAVCSDCLTIGDDAIQKLNEAAREGQRLQERNRQASVELPRIVQANKTLEPLVQQLEQDYNTQKALNDSLNSKAQEYSKEKCEAVRQENDRLLVQIAADKAKHDKLKEEQQKHNAEMADIQAKIDAMPAERQLVADYDRKKSELERLQKAQVDCSLEKQSELENQIYELEKVVSKLEADMEVLRKKEQSVLAAKTNIETQKGVFETEFIARLREAMDDLKNTMAAHKETLNGLKDDAEALQKSIEECSKVCQNYRFMFDTMNDPLTAIANASSVEYETLKKYLDINVSQRVGELKNAIRRDLDELGTIIDKCREATTADQKKLMHKVFTAK